MGDIFVRLIDIPGRVKGYTAPDANDDYNIYINARLCCQQQREAYLHEIRHIKNGHFSDMYTVQEAKTPQEPQNVPIWWLFAAVGAAVLITVLIMKKKPR